MAFSVAGTVGTVVTPGGTKTQLRAKGDGNCLFHAVGYLLERAGKTVPAPTDVATLRTLACDEIARLLDDPTPLEVKTRCRLHVHTVKDVLAGDDLAQTNARAQYLVDMRKDGSWGDALCIYALERVYAVRIEVFQLDHRGAAAVASFPAGVGDTLRLVMPYTGRKGVYNHYDPLVDVPTDQEKAPADPEEKPLSDPKKWEYWNPANLYLFQPASCHSMYGDLWTPTPSARGRELAVSNTNAHVVDVAKPTVARVSLVSPRMKANSASFRADLARADRGVLDKVTGEVFMLTLTRDKDGKAQALADVSDVTLEVDLTLFESVVKLNLAITTRGKAEPVVSVDVLREALVELASGESGEQKLRLKLGEVFSEENLRLLVYGGSPYRLVACTNGPARGEGVDATQWAFTYFHVPHPWDINTPEGVQAARIIPLDDKLTKLKTVSEVTVLPRSDVNDAAVKPPAGVGDEGGRPGKMGQFLTQIGAGAYVPHLSNVFWQLADETYFVATSWASIIVLVRDADGDYQAHSLLLHGGGKSLHVVSLAEQRGSTAIVDERHDLLSTLRTTLKEQVIKQRAYDNSKSWTNAAEPQKQQLDAQKLKVGAAVTAIRRHPATLDYLGKANSLFVLEEKKSIDERTTRLDELIRPLKGLIDAGAEELKRAAVRKPALVLEGEGDFEGFRPGTHPGWDQYLLEPGLKVSKMMTQGISSCAGGCTFTNEKLPSVLILWHIDFPPYVPIKGIIEQLWPDLAKAPDLRTVAFVFPDCGELNKYRDAQLYPAAMRDRCQTVFMTRGDHLGVQDFSLGSGAETFGLDLSDRARPDLVFTHDFDKRTEMVGKRINATTDAEVSITLDSFHKTVFGSYRYDGIPVEGEDRVSMKQYVAKVNVEDADVKRDKKSKCSVVRLKSVGPTLFSAMDAVAKPVLETPCYMLGLRVEQEFTGASTQVQSERLWRTGHQDRSKPKKSESEK